MKIRLLDGKGQIFEHYYIHACNTEENLEEDFREILKRKL